MGFFSSLMPSSLTEFVMPGANLIHKATGINPERKIFGSGSQSPFPRRTEDTGRSPEFQAIFDQIRQRRADSLAAAGTAQPRQQLAPLNLGPVPPAAIATQAAPQAGGNFPTVNPLLAAFLQSLIGNQGQAAAPPFNFGQLISGG